MDADQSPHQLSSCLSLSGASGFSLSVLPPPPLGLPPSPHQLQPIPCSAGPSLCDPGEGGLPSQGGRRSFSPLLPQASLRSFRPCFWSPAALWGSTPTRPSGSRGGTAIPLPASANNGLFLSLSSGRLIVSYFHRATLHSVIMAPQSINGSTHNMLCNVIARRLHHNLLSDLPNPVSCTFSL